jgi:glycogen(starch) synthase
VEDFAPYNPIFSFRVRRDAAIQLHQREGLNLLRKYLLAGLPFFLMEKFYHRCFRSVVVVSETSRKKYGLGGATVVIGNGFDSHFLSVKTSERDYLLFLGRIEVDSKGIDILLKGMNYLEGVTLRIAGKGKDDETVRNLLKKTNPLNDIKMVGFLQGEAKVDILKDCMFVIIPSRFEGRPVTLLEAAAFGKPVIMSDIPELQCAVDAGFGLSFRRGDPKDLADKIRFLLDNESLRREMGIRAKKYAKDFTWDRIAEEYEGFLSDIVSRGRDKGIIDVVE